MASSVRTSQSDDFLLQDPQFFATGDVPGIWARLGNQDPVPFRARLEVRLLLGSAPSSSAA
jgi:hypothetical protein